MFVFRNEIVNYIIDSYLYTKIDFRSEKDEKKIARIIYNDISTRHYANWL